MRVQHRRFRLRVQKAYALVRQPVLCVLHLISKSPMYRRLHVYPRQLCATPAKSFAKSMLKNAARFWQNHNRAPRSNADCENCRRLSFSSMILITAKLRPDFGEPKSTLRMKQTSILKIARNVKIAHDSGRSTKFPHSAKGEFRCGGVIRPQELLSFPSLCSSNDYWRCLW